jgi:hypothetical protein
VNTKTSNPAPQEIRVKIANTLRILRSAFTGPRKALIAFGEKYTMNL